MGLKVDYQRDASQNVSPGVSRLCPGATGSQPQVEQNSSVNSSLHAPADLPRGKISRYPLDMRHWVEYRREKILSMPVPGIEPRSSA
jgi:hypothetical protein